MLSPADQYLLDNIYLFIPAVFISTSALVFIYISLTYQVTKVKRFKRIQFEMVEAERKRIANDLHDFVGGRLVQVREQLLNSIPQLNDEKLAKEIHDSILQIRSFHDDVRHLVEYIYPREMMKGDWRGSFERMAYDMSSTKTQVQIEVEEELELPLETAKHVFMICQEKITNVFAHEKVEHIAVDIFCSEDGKYGVLDMVYRNNSYEPVPENTKRMTVNGRGLLSIEERVKSISGRYKKFIMGEFLHDSIEFPLRK